MTLHDILSHIEGLQDNKDPISALAQLRWISKAVTEAQAVVDPKALAEAERYPKRFVHGGISWTRKQGSKKYVFDGIPEVESIKQMLLAQQERHKMAADLILGNSMGVAMQDGCVQIGDELIQPAKVQYSKDSLVMDKGQN